MADQYHKNSVAMASSTATHQQDAGRLNNRAFLRGTKILIVEDFELNRNLFKTFLLHFATDVDTAENGLHALQLIERNQTENPSSPYDAIIMDIHMPVMNGYEATTRLRAIEEYSLLPIIGLSATMMDNETKDCLKYGMNDFVRKPVDVDELLTVLAKWISRGQPE
ncbi:response regulator [Methylomonas sp. LL1]|uniref:response regulator n=1 Tax=Methylomonas sp. LL1 TaxID=2785785 RepID=UPI0018C40546|nr:response regulator [Methylomonas sp. LL1]QPK64251.1 response regulator [Methylomonas sp. LL1]